MGVRGPQPSSGRWLRNYSQTVVGYGEIPAEWWAYAAGLMDGEGTIRANLRKRGTGTIQIEVCNTYLPVLEEMAQVLGGIIREARQNSTGNHPVYEFGMWRSYAVRHILEHMFPYLRIKRWKAALAIMFLRRAHLNCRGPYDRQLLLWLRQIGGYQGFSNVTPSAGA